MNPWLVLRVRLPARWFVTNQEHEAKMENWNMKLKTSQCRSLGLATLNRMMNCSEKITSATERQKIRPEGCWRQALNWAAGGDNSAEISTGRVSNHS